MRREFQFVGGGSSKSWAIELTGQSFTVQFGRLGTAGQTQTKEFGSEAEARKACDQLIAEKIRKGYVETATAGATPPQATRTPEAPPARATRSKPASKPRSAEAEEPNAEGAAPESPAGTGTSSPTTAGTAGTGATGEPAQAAVASGGPTAAGAPVVATGASVGADDSATKLEPAGADDPATRAEPAAASSVTRRIALDDRDWHWATWLPHRQVERPPARPFDREECLRKLGRITVNDYGWWNWEPVRSTLGPSLEPAEAAFWLAAVSRTGKGVKPAQVAATLASKPPSATPSFDEVCGLFAKAAQAVTLDLTQFLVSLLSPGEIVTLLMDTDVVLGKGGQGAGHWNLLTEVNDGLHEHLLPYLTEAEREQIRQRVEPRVDIQAWPTDFYARPSPIFHLAAMVGASAPLLPLVRGWKDNLYRDAGWDHTHYHQPQLIVLGLGDPQLVNAEMRRLKLPLNTPRYLRAWLANTGLAGLDYARDCILAVTNKEECEALAQVFARVEAPEAAPPMLELRLSSRAPKVARQWLQDHLSLAVAGLVETASGRGRLADAAIEFLRDVKRQGREDLVRRALDETPPATDRIRREVIDRKEKVYTPFDATTTPDWLAEAVGAQKRKPLKPLPWMLQDALPPLAVGDACLNAEQVGAVLADLAQATFESVPPLVKALRAHVDAEALDAFAWRLFELWLGEGAPPKEKWAMAAVGVLGGDRSALRITPMIRAWPGESQHQRAVAGLDCLRAIGTDTALMGLNGIAQKLPFKALKARAAECMEAIATQRRMTRAELEDRIVPDCDLDERGTRVFDFGPRQFRFVLGPEMKPMVKDSEGRAKPDLPAPNSKDDAEKAAEAVASWKLLKKQVKEVARIQAERLEQAMVTGRRWTVDEFQLLLVRHPLMVNLVRLVVWGGYDAEGRLLTTFRVTEDQEAADSGDNALALDGIAKVGVVHPLHLPDDQKRAWGEVFTDYEIIPPFPQLGRATYALEPGEAPQSGFTRFQGREIPATALVGTLERLAWARGIPEDGGVFHEHTKPFPGAGVTAVVTYEGVPVGYMEGWEDQEIENCFFVPGLYTPTMYPDHKHAMPLGAVDPVVISEVLKDLTLLASKAR